MNTTVNIDGVVYDIISFNEHTGSCQVVCEICGKSITLRTIKNTQPLRTHKSSKSCRKNRKGASSRRGRGGSRQPSLGSNSESLHSLTPSASGSVRGDTPLSESTFFSSAQAGPSSSHTPSLSHALHVSLTPLSTSGTSTPQPLSASPFIGATPTSERYPLAAAFNECQGVRVQWTVGSVWSTYPLDWHEVRPQPWEPIAFDLDMHLRLRSRNCVSVATSGNSCCQNCMVIPESDEYTNFIARSNIHNVEDQFVITNVPSLVSSEKLSGKTKVDCLLCGSNMPLARVAQMRNHVGHHIIYALRGMPDDSLKSETQVGVDPCGFCGLVGCYVQLVEEGKSHRILLNCKYHYAKMRYSAAIKCSASSPCTNVPIHCHTCKPTSSGLPRTIWKYNAIYHITCDHPLSLAEGRIGPSVEPRLLIDMHISLEEEGLMKIEREMMDTYREEHGVLMSDDIVALVEAREELAEETAALKRDRTDSVLSTQLPTKRIR